MQYQPCSRTFATVHQVRKSRLLSAIEQPGLQQLHRAVQILHIAPRGTPRPIAGRIVPASGGTLAPRMHSCIAKEKKMLWTICIILLVLWALGMATAYTASGLIHLLLVLAVVVMIIRLIQGRRVV